MTAQLKAALDALKACRTANDVAAMLRRHGIRGTRNNCRRCPIATYLEGVGGMERPYVDEAGRVTQDGRFAEARFVLPYSCVEFISEFDAEAAEFQDLRTEAAK